jgi:hypothetical protein
MSALPPKADIRQRDWDVRFVPKGVIRVDSEIREVRKLVNLVAFLNFAKVSGHHISEFLVFLTVPMHHTDAGL